MSGVGNTPDPATECAPDCAERDECPTPREPLHLQCGHCTVHDVPMHHCGCWATNPEAVRRG